MEKAKSLFGKNKALAGFQRRITKKQNELDEKGEQASEMASLTGGKTSHDVSELSGQPDPNRQRKGSLIGLKKPKAKAVTKNSDIFSKDQSRTSLISNTSKKSKKRDGEKRNSTLS
jgi:ABC-type taurine transport system substrate-binding protein